MTNYENNSANYEASQCAPEVKVFGKTYEEGFETNSLYEVTGKGGETIFAIVQEMMKRINVDYSERCPIRIATLGLTDEQAKIKQGDKVELNIATNEIRITPKNGESFIRNLNGIDVTELIMKQHKERKAKKRGNIKTVVEPLAKKDFIHPRHKNNKMSPELAGRKGYDPNNLILKPEPKLNSERVEGLLPNKEKTKIKPKLIR